MINEMKYRTNTTVMNVWIMINHQGVNKCRILSNSGEKIHQHPKNDCISASRRDINPFKQNSQSPSDLKDE